jgi:hypothetical protein
MYSCSSPYRRTTATKGLASKTSPLLEEKRLLQRLADPALAQRIVESGRGDLRHSRLRQPPSHDCPVAAVDDRRQVEPPIPSAEDVFPSTRQ